MNATRSTITVWLLAASLCAVTGRAQEGPPRGQGGPPPEVNSPVVDGERRVTFRILAPDAKSVRLTTSDIPDAGRGLEMKKGENGVWEVVTAELPAGAYRYSFSVDGVTVVDPRNPATSESNTNTWSLVVVPGSELFDTSDVPHGAVSEVTYYSSALKRFRRMHVYTPPGYESNDEKYPVFYLLHGVFDSDDSWTSVGRAGFILDNLIAAGKAKPMLLVMPAGHTGPFRFGPPGAGANGFQRQMEEFEADFRSDVRPYVEKHYRVIADAPHRAIAGLSMGGAQTLNIAITDLKDYAYIGVYSSGVFGIAGGRGTPPDEGWVERHKAALADAEAKKGLRLVWFATGKGDFLVDTSVATVKMLKDNGFDVVYKETEGGHTWLNWRDYLAEFAPLLFRDAK